MGSKGPYWIAGGYLESGRPSQDRASGANRAEETLSLFVFADSEVSAAFVESKAHVHT